MEGWKLTREDFASEADWRRAATEGGVFDLPARRRERTIRGAMRVHVDPPGIRLVRVNAGEMAETMARWQAESHALDAGERA